MFIGHHAVGFAAKRYAPRTSLGTLFIAATLLDLLWPICLLLGIEHVRVVPNRLTPFLSFEFDYPWTHSLLMSLVWSVAFALLYWIVARYGAGAIAVGIAVFSHWVLDWITHLPDLPLWPGGPKVGLGLWKSTGGTLAAELLLFAIGIFLYVRTTRPRRRRGTVLLAVLVVFLLLGYFAALASQPPPDQKAIGWGGLVGWLLVLLPWWVDRNREPRA